MTRATRALPETAQAPASPAPGRRTGPNCTASQTLRTPEATIARGGANLAMEWNAWMPIRR